MSKQVEEEEINKDVSSPKQLKPGTSLECAFTNLKNSEFYQSSKDAIEAGSSGINAPSKLNVLQVSPKQKGNPLLKFITNIPWEYADIIPDYVMGKTTCALFLSIKYHQLNPDYIHDRLKLLGNSYRLRVLLVQIDIADPHHALKHLTRMSILANLTLMLAWNAEDAGKIIETYKIYENKPPDLIMERNDVAVDQKIINALTTVRSVNKTDAMTLLGTFGTLENIIKATPNSISLCPGFGQHKAQKLYKVLHEPFLITRKSNK